MNIQGLTEQIKFECDKPDPVFYYCSNGSLEFARKLIKKVGYGNVIYLPQLIHYVAEINGRLYDVNGDMTSLFSRYKKIYSSSIDML